MNKGLKITLWSLAAVAALVGGYFGYKAITKGGSDNSETGGSDSDGNGKSPSGSNDGLSEDTDNTVPSDDNSTNDGTKPKKHIIKKGIKSYFELQYGKSNWRKKWNDFVKKCREYTQNKKGVAKRHWRRYMVEFVNTLNLPNIRNYAFYDDTDSSDSNIGFDGSNDTAVLTYDLNFVGKEIDV